MGVFHVFKIVQMVPNGTKDLIFRALSNIYDGAFCQNKSQLSIVNWFVKVPSYMFHRVLNTGLLNILRQWNKARKIETSYCYNRNTEWEFWDEWVKHLFITSVWIFNSAHVLLPDSTFTTTLSCLPVNS